MQTTATKVIKFNAVAGLHSIVLSYAELIDYGNAATIQILQYLHGVLPRAIRQKNDCTLAITVTFAFFKSQYFPVGVEQINCFTWKSVIKCSSCSKIYYM